MISTLKKKLNKKGFTLAELLVVVAIIAILVAIAIPTFSAATKKAKLAVDDANIRSAYAMLKVAQLTGGVDVGGTETYPTADATYYMTKNGTLTTDADAAYLTQAAHSPCEVEVAGSITHAENKKITITYTKDSNTWALSVA